MKFLMLLISGVFGGIYRQLLLELPVYLPYCYMDSYTNIKSDII